MTATKEAQIDIREHLDTIGHASLINLLQKAISSGRMPHAYLFVGPQHVGKMMVARGLATTLFGADSSLETHPDFVQVFRREDPKTGKLQNGILLDQVQDLRSRLSMGAMMRGWKVAVIDDADLMNKESSNALLKSLEEPHPKTLLLLLATSSDKVLPTITSRCQEIRFSRVPIVELTEALMEKGVSPQDATLYARLSGGRPGLALQYMEDPQSLQEMKELRREIFALPQQSVAARWAIIGGVIPAKTPFNEAGKNAQEFLDLVAELLRDLVLIYHDSAETIVHVDAESDYRVWLQHISYDAAEDALHALAHARTQIAANVNPKTVLEHFLLSF